MQESIKTFESQKEKELQKSGEFATKKAKRRDFLKKSFAVGAVAGAGALSSNEKLFDEHYEGNGVVLGKAVKKEILYKKNLTWEKYYKTVY